MRHLRHPRQEPSVHLGHSEAPESPSLGCLMACALEALVLFVLLLAAGLVLGMSRLSG